MPIDDSCDGKIAISVLELAHVIFQVVTIEKVSMDGFRKRM